MDEAQESLNQDSSAEEVQENAGVDSQSDDSMNESEAGSLAKDSDPHAVKKRSGMQAKRHQKDIRALQEQIRQMQAQMGSAPASQDSSGSGYMQPPNVAGMSIEDQIKHGVDYALRARDEQERKAKEMERMQHVHKGYQKLHDEFDKASEKYEDFDDVVRGDDAPFTPHVRDALLLVDNPADVAYKLGKNRDELARIAQLHPLDQAREVNKLSFALMGGNRQSAAPSGSKPMSQIKANPVTSHVNNSAAAIRAKIKAGTWK